MTEIVVGIDDSAGAKDALAFAARVAASTGASLRLANAYPYGDLPIRAASQDVRSYLRQDSQETLERAVATVEGVSASTVTIADPSPPRALHDLGERTKAALLVVGSTRRGPVGRVMPGSTGERLLHGASAPVAIVPRGYAEAGPIRTVGVGFDGTPESMVALTSAAQIARHFGALLKVIRIYDATRVGAPALMTIPGYVAEQEDWEARQREGLDEAIAALPEDLGAEAVFVAGSPGPELAAQTENVDLMIVGSRGYGPRAAVLLGGVTHTVIRKAACPVIVLPRGSRGLDTLLESKAQVAAS